MPSYTITDTFIGAGVGQNGLTVNAYADARFTTPPAKNAAAPDGNAPDATATTGSSYGNDGSFQLTVSNPGRYWVSVTYSSVTYWKLYNVVPVGGAVSGLTRYGTGAPASGTGNVGDYYVDEATGNLYGPKRPAAVTFVASAVSNAAAVTVPAQTTAGMLMVLFIDSFYTYPSAPAGWTTLANTDASNGSGHYAYYGAYYKIATASDAGTAVSNGSGNSNSEMTLVVYSSAGAPTYLNGSAVSNTNATGAPPTSVTLPAETLKGTGDLALAAVGYTDQASPTNLVISGPAGSTLRGATSGSNGGRGFAITFAELPASGTSVAASTFTIANDTTTTSPNQGFQGMVLDVPLLANAWPLATTLVANPPASSTAAKLPTYLQAVLNDGPAGVWMLNDAAGSTAAADASGFANPAMTLSAGTFGNPAIIPSSSGTSYALTSQPSVGLSTTAPITTAVASWTIEAVIKTGTLPASADGMVFYNGQDSAPTDGGYGLCVTTDASSNQRFQLLFGGVLYLNMVYAVTPGTVYHVVATYDGTTVRLYVNGAVVYTGNPSAGPSTVAGGTYIGCCGPNNRGFVGSIEGVAFYKYPLTAGQVAQHYASHQASSSAVGSLR